MKNSLTTNTPTLKVKGGEGAEKVTRKYEKSDAQYNKELDRAIEKVSELAKGWVSVGFFIPGDNQDAPPIDEWRITIPGKKLYMRKRCEAFEFYVIDLEVIPTTEKPAVEGGSSK